MSLVSRCSCRTSGVSTGLGRLCMVLALAGHMACANPPREPQSPEQPPLGAASQLPEFAADPATRMSPSQWNARREQVLALPGARVDQDGPLLVSVSVGPPNPPQFYLFTTPRHPAHPALVRLVPSGDNSTKTQIEGGFAGSQAEYEKFVREFLAYMQASQ